MESSTKVPRYNSTDESASGEFRGAHVPSQQQSWKAGKTSQFAVDDAASVPDALAPLTAEQQNAADCLVRCCKIASRQGKSRPQLWNFGFQAGAGCGKNYTAAHPTGLLAQLRGAGFSVGIAAPTHIACSVSREYLQKSGIQIETRTLHSILGMKPVKDGAQQRFLPIGESSLDLFDVLLIDEASMVSPQLFWEAQKQRQHQVFIWMGDPSQLPPVSEDSSDFEISPALDEQNLLDVYQLEETHRFGGPLLEKATLLRTEPGEWRARWKAQGDSIRTVPDEFDLRDAFGKQLKAGDGSVRMMAYTNRRVDYWNRIAHARLFGGKADPYLAGMTLLSRQSITPNAVHKDDRKYIQGEPLQLWGSSYEIDILEDVEQTKISLDEQPSEWAPFDAWLIKAHSPFTRQEHWVQVLHESEKGRFQGYLKDIANYAKRSKGEKRQELWSLFWTWKESFADVQPAYASTVHRAQGQGIDHVFLDLLDLKRTGQKSPELAQALIYTASTRARKSITALGEE